MADNGMILKNFHAASPVCSPSRASIMTGLFPWRVGIDFIYGDVTLKKDGTEELDHEQLPLVSNLPMTLHDAGYFTAHIGKWHLGGISLEQISARARGDCTSPGIIQYGYDEYVAMSEGPGSMRFRTGSITKNTYHVGSKYLYMNDIPLPNRNVSEILTDRQTDEAMRVMRERVKQQNPFFLNLWFDAPHSPWEAIEPYFSKYNGKFKSQKMQKYASMISNMDMNIGRILNLINELNIAENTLVLFLSDNGPENGAGFTGQYKGRKRSLMEGGILVPAIAQWKGVIRKGTISSNFLLGFLSSCVARCLFCFFCKSFSALFCTSINNEISKRYKLYILSILKSKNF